LTQNDTGFRQTHVLVVRLIRITIETGSLTDMPLVMLTNLALAFGFPGKSYFSTAGLVIPRLYANTIFAVLNARMQIFG
ncbi:hypothetical protein C8R44DRAFT_566086, partial [Mycena epipterygia]